MKKLFFLSLFLWLISLTFIEYLGGGFTSYAFYEVTKPKEGYISTYLVIPQTVDITNEDKFKVSAVNNKNEKIFPSSGRGNPDDKMNILLE